MHSFFWKEMSMLGEMAKRSSTKFAIFGILQKKPRKQVGFLSFPFHATRHRPNGEGSTN